MFVWFPAMIPLTRRLQWDGIPTGRLAVRLFGWRLANSCQSKKTHVANANDPCSCGKVAYRAVHAPSKPRKEWQTCEGPNVRANQHWFEHVGLGFLPSSINLSSLQFILKSLLRLNNSAHNLFFGWQLDLVPLDSLIPRKATKRVAMLSPSS